MDGGFLCHVCANDSCDQTGETFKVLWSDASTVDLVNDTTGVVGQDVNGKPDRLTPGGEHGVVPAAAHGRCDVLRLAAQ